MTMTAGAQSRKPSRRSAFAPSDRGTFFGRRPAAGSAASVPAATCTLSLIGGLLPDGSRDQSLGLEGVAELADHLLLGALGADARGGRDQVRDVDRHDLVDGRLRA